MIEFFQALFLFLLILALLRGFMWLMSKPPKPSEPAVRLDIRVGRISLK